MDLITRAVQAAKEVFRRDCNPRTPQNDIAEQTTEAPKSSKFDEFISATQIAALPKLITAKVQSARDSVITVISTVRQVVQKNIITPVCSVAVTAKNTTVELYQSGKRLIADCVTSVKSFCNEVYTSVKNTYNKVYASIKETCNDIYDTCKKYCSAVYDSIVKVFDSISQERKEQTQRKEEERKLEDKRFWDRLEEKRFEEKRIERKQNETERIEARQRIAALEAKREQKQNKLDFIQSTGLVPLKINASSTEERISAQVASIRAAISNLSHTSDSEIWQLAKTINGKISILNDLSNELHLKQELFKEQMRDFTRVAHDLDTMRHRVSYTGWA